MQEMCQMNITLIILMIMPNELRIFTIRLSMGTMLEMNLYENWEMHIISKMNNKCTNKERHQEN